MTYITFINYRTLPDPHPNRPNSYMVRAPALDTMGRGFESSWVTPDTWELTIQMKRIAYGVSIPGLVESLEISCSLSLMSDSKNCRNSTVANISPDVELQQMIFPYRCPFYLESNFLFLFPSVPWPKLGRIDDAQTHVLEGLYFEGPMSFGARIRSTYCL